jgi:hypothetical protein
MPLTDQQIEQRLLAGREGFYFTGSEALRITSLNSVTGVTLTLVGRFLPCDQLKPVDVSKDHTPNTDRTAATSDLPMGEGWLQSLTVIASGGSTVIGATFVRVDVVRGSGGSATIVATLLQGFVTAAQRLAWPGSLLEHTIAGVGRLRVVSGSDPAAGAEISETVPTGARWRLLSWRASLVTDATVANRVMSLLIDDGSLTLWQSATPTAHTASLSVSYIFGLGATSANQQGVMLLSTPAAPLVLPAGYRIRTTTSNLQAGDNWGSPVMFVEEWLEGA